MAVTGVVFIPPVMILIPAFCTLVSLLVLVFAAVALADDPYSITGLMAPVYNCLRILLLATHFVPASFFHNEELSCCPSFQHL